MVGSQLGEERREEMAEWVEEGEMSTVCGRAEQVVLTVSLRHHLLQYLHGDEGLGELPLVGRGMYIHATVCMCVCTSDVQQYQE